MDWEQKYLDLILVPSGLLILFCYHLYLLYRCIKHPGSTVIGYENHIKRNWIERILQVDAKDRGSAITVLGSNITAATFLSSTSLALSSLIGTWVGNSSHNIFMTSLIYGDTSSTMVTIKYVSLLSCFILAFSSFVQAARYFVQVDFFISMPNSEIPVNYVQKAMIRGNTFWSLGLRAVYFAIALLLWIFGPIPMFVSSLILVVIMHNLDQNSYPLPEFQPAKGHHLLKKLGDEITTVARAIEHHDRQSKNQAELQVQNMDGPLHV